MTLARLLKISLGVLVFLSALWLLVWWQRGWPKIAVIGAAAILLCHVPILALEFMFARWQNRVETAPAPTMAELCRAWWVESVSAVVVFAWHQAMHSTRYRDHVPTNMKGQRGLILVHGFMCNRGVWNLWWPRLRAQDAPVVALSLQPVLGSIDRYASQIDDAVRQLTLLTGRPPVVVAHSMGGLAVRAWMQRFDAGDRVHRVVTVASPHRGTWLARFGLGFGARQMQYASPWVTSLQETEPKATQSKFICYYSRCDNIVMPCSSATLPNADNRHLRGFAHVHLLNHPDIFVEVMRLLRQ